MKRMMLMGVMALGALVSVAQSAEFGIEGISSVVIPVTVGKMTNLVFPEAIQVGVKVSPDIQAQKVKGVENVIELKAVRKDFAATNLSVYGKDGRLYSFLLRYVTDTPVLNFRVVVRSSATGVMRTGMPAALGVLREDAYGLCGRRAYLRITGRTEGLQLRLCGIYVKDSLEWLVCRLSDRSAAAFSLTYSRFYLEDKRPVQRRAQQDRSLEPVYAEIPRLVAGASSLRFAVGLRPLTVPKGKRLVVEMAGADGRTIVMKVKGTVVDRAKSQ